LWFHFISFLNGCWLFSLRDCLGRNAPKSQHNRFYLNATRALAFFGDLDTMIVAQNDATTQITPREVERGDGEDAGVD
jgi:hypothetical protein